MTTLVKGGTLVNEGRTFNGSLVIENEKITRIIEETIRPKHHLMKSLMLRAVLCCLVSSTIMCISVSQD